MGYRLVTSMIATGSDVIPERDFSSVAAVGDSTEYGYDTDIAQVEAKSRSAATRVNNRIPLLSPSGHYGFTHRERDPESGLMHYRARSYDPRLGRFVQKDPEHQDANHYLYAANTPVNAVDPSGRIVIYVHGIGPSQHRDKVRDMASGMRDTRKSEGMVEQHVIHFLYGPAGKWDAWDQDSDLNKKAAVKLKGLVERLQAERLQLSNDEKAKGGKGDVEPIYILSYSNGTIVTTLGLLLPEWVIFA